MPRYEADPCPRCGRVPETWERVPETVLSNPTSVIPAPPGGIPIVNPAPDRTQDETIVLFHWVTFQPCGDQLTSYELAEAGWNQRVIYAMPDLPETMTVEELKHAAAEIMPGTRLRVAYETHETAG